MGKTSREKGKRGELELVHELQRLGFPDVLGLCVICRCTRVAWHTYRVQADRETIPLQRLRTGRQGFCRIHRYTCCDASPK